MSSRKKKVLFVVSGAILLVAVAAVLLGVLLTQQQLLSESNTNESEVLPRSSSGELLVAEVEDADGNHVIVARSYDGNAWEPVVGMESSEMATITCDEGSTCSISTAAAYSVQAVAVPEELVDVTPLELAARLHMQATFGASKSELQRVVTAYGTNYSNWILDQMRLNPTFTRAYYRQRANARPGQYAAGQVVESCDIGSRWTRYAFDIRDKSKKLVVSLNATTSRFLLTVDGQLRGEVTSFMNQPYPGTLRFPATLYFCTVNEELNGTVTLSLINGTTSCNMTWLNPAIEFTGTNNAIQTLGENDALLVPVVGARAGAYVLKWRLVACRNASDAVGNSYIRQSGSTYRFDQRLRFIENTLENPAAVGLSFDGQCPIIAKSYQNRDFCVRRSGCSPALSFKSALVPLNETILRAWYTRNTRYIYYVTDLRLEDPYNVSPCKSGVSRWRRLGAITCPAPTALDTTTLTTISNALRASTDTNAYVVDITLSGANCNSNASSIGAQVQAGTQCFQHVHPDLYSVRDFTRWVEIHDGNQVAMQGGRPNPIANWALKGGVNLKFPASHPMSRFFLRRSNIPLIGRLGDKVPFLDLNAELQTEEMAALVGALRTTSADAGGVEACGSPSEVSTTPDLGYHYSVYNNEQKTKSIEYLDHPLPASYDPVFVLNNIALTSVDQLRQRMAWSLANIFTIGMDIGYGDHPDAWTSYYDTFVRNAFGSFTNILRDVSFHPLMGLYLTYNQNKGYAVQGTYPDENYAREIMQLYSIGLWKLNDNGTRQLDASGKPIETYTNADILDFARVWTGFDRQRYRTNNGMEEGQFGLPSNNVDPMQIRPQWRDRLPKAKLDSGYLGDGYPLCDELPPQSFLRKDARYEYTGDFSVEGDLLDDEVGPVGLRGRFAPTPNVSALHQALCAPSAANKGACTFPLRVILSKNLACRGKECTTERIISVKIVDPVANVTKYYSYVPPACVRLTFFNDGRLLKRASTRSQCADPVTRVAAPVCCRSTALTRAASNYTSECNFANEVTDYATAAKRCTALGLSVCSSGLTDSASFANSCASNVYMWTSGNCSVTIQVYPSGQVGIVDPATTQFKILANNSNNVFRVRWTNNVYPAAQSGVCPTSCVRQVTPNGDSCICNFTVSTSVVYTMATLGALASNPSQAANTIGRRITIGASNPTIFNTGTYVQCIRPECSNLTNVIVWLHKDDPNGTLSTRTIIQVPAFRLGGRVRYLFNRQSVVRVGTTFSFQNPPHFTPLLGELTDVSTDYTSDALWTRKAEYEVEALLEHLAEHQSTAPFIAYRLIQQLVTSNPTPRYVSVVVNAFRSGTYAGIRFSGQYGDLGATIYAILMDREARTPLLEADRTHGMLKDPLIKLYHLMRSLVYRSPRQREIALWNLNNRIGVQPFGAPSVFGFYLPEYSPAGPIAQAGLVSPQAQLATSPNLLGFLNGATSLVDIGLTSCDSGFGLSQNTKGRSCTRIGPDHIDGSLTYVAPANNNTAAAVIDDLNLLLTAGRLHKSMRDTLTREYNAIVNRTQALNQVVKLIVASSEYQTNSLNLLTATQRTAPPVVPGGGRRFKAIVVVFEIGGFDSYNLVVPHSLCTGKDLYAEYQTVRQGAALNQSQVLQIDVAAGTQPCRKFGVHPAMPKLKQLYVDRDAMFVANIGAMVEPITKDEYNKKTKRVPPSLFAHNIMQRSVQNVHAQDISAEGILGRITDAVVQNAVPFKSAIYSFAGKTKMVQGSTPADFLSPTGGVIQMRDLARIRNGLNNITQFVSDSVFAETYADGLFNSLIKSESLGTMLSKANLTTTFGTSSLDQQMQQVAKLIKMLPTQEKVERAVFFTQTGGFDTHNTFDLAPLLSPIDSALGSFATEMKAQGRWDDVVVVSASDFARTLASNGKGTDHAWGGNHFVAGGKVNGGRILGSYPTTLTDEGELSLGRGRLIPSTPFEAVWTGISEWFGVTPAQMAEVLPNAVNFPKTQLFNATQMFTP